MLLTPHKPMADSELQIIELHQLLLDLFQSRIFVYHYFFNPVATDVVQCAVCHSHNNDELLHNVLILTCTTYLQSCLCSEVAPCPWMKPIAQLYVRRPPHILTRNKIRT